MKKFFLSMAIAIFAFCSQTAAQDLTLTGDPGYCGDVYVIATVYDGSCRYLASTIQFTVSPAGGSTTYDLTQSANWPGGSVPGGSWTIEEIFVTNICGWGPTTTTTLGCTSNTTNAVTMTTGINCGSIVTNDCFEHDTNCGSCSTGDDIFVTLSVAGTDVDVIIQ